MENEFGIPPTRIVEAMTNLSDSQMLAKPEDTAAQVIDKLDLPEKESEQAYVMYMALLQKLSAIPPQNQLPAKAEMLPPATQAILQAMTPQQIAALNGLKNPALATTEMSAVQVAQQSPDRSALLNQLSMKERRAYVNDSLDRMNQKFFMSQPETKLPTEVASMMQQDLSPEDLQGLQQIQNYQPQGLVLLDKNRELGAAPLPDLEKGQQRAATAEALGLDEQEYDQLTSKLAALGISAAEVEKAVKNDPQNQAALKIEKQMNQQSLGPDFNVAMSALMQKNSSQDGDGSQNSNPNDGKSKENSLQSLGKHSAKVTGQEFSAAQTQAMAKPDTLPLTGKIGGMGSADAVAGQAPKDHSVNIQQVMNQANYMIKKGGGEAIIKLNPEGLGQVHLKVAVQDGKVNVMMNADSKEAKNIIESSLHDLKHSLSAKNLSLDSIKVDVGSSMSSSTENSNNHSQKNMDMNQQARQQTQAFFQQMREDTMSGRNQFIEIPGAKAYNSQKQPPVLQPVEDAKVASRRYQGTGKGRELNLVA